MNRMVKWAGIGLGTIAVLLIIAAAALYVVGGSRLAAPTDLRDETLDVTADSAAVAWGAHLAMTHGCQECHAPDLRGQVLMDVPPFRVVASNLTGGAGGVGAHLDTGGWERAIRHGVGADGRALAIMPSEFYTHMSDREVAALIAYLRSAAAVDNVLPATKIKPLGRIIAATGGFQPTSALIDQTAAHAADNPPMAATVAYGEYRSATICAGCHGPDLRGAQPPQPDSPPAPSLIPAAYWTLDEFHRAVTTGQTPARQVNGEYMPYAVFANMMDEEIEAIWLYLNRLASDAPPGQQVTQ